MNNSSPKCSHLGITCYSQTVEASFEGPGSGTVAVVEGETATLICGTGLMGNPLPTISWTDNKER